MDGEGVADESFLEYAAKNQTSDSRVRRWISDVQELAFKAEDIVDSSRSDAVNSSRFFSRYKYSPSRIIARHKFGTRVGRLKESIDDLTRRRSTYGIQSMQSQDPVIDHQLREARRLRAEYYDEDKDVVGLEPHIEAIIERLGVGVERYVVSIVGMGGLGKTTLAKKVFKRMTYSSTFDGTAWIVVSQEYNYLQVLQTLAQSEYELVNELREFLCEKKYLIVLDDVWKTQVFDEFRGTFPNPGNGSKVIITTRSLDIGRLANPGMDPYELPCLDEKAAWELFARKVFPYEENPNECCTVELMRLGKKMVEKCSGLPLAIVVLGGLLSSKVVSVFQWSKIADIIKWHEGEMADGCMSILALSYEDLPFHLRWCFLYLGIFPDDSRINVQNLLRLWIAEGFVIKTDGENPEETAERYVEELIQRCLVQVAEKNSYGRVKYLRVHDLLLDLVIEKAKCARFLDIWRDGRDVNSTSNSRRLVVYKDYDSKHLFPLKKNLPSVNFLRSLFMHNTFFKDIDRDAFCTTKLLRVLDLSLRKWHTHEEIGCLANLRYLTLRTTPYYHTLPSSLGKLKHLQTLQIDVNALPEERRMPNSFWGMKKLRHLTGRNTGLYFPDPPKVTIMDNILPNLRTLWGIKAGSWIETILPKLIHLKDLSIVDISEHGGYIVDISDAIEKLQQLNTLRLEGYSILDMGRVFFSIHTHEHLRELELEGVLRNNMSCCILPQNLAIVSLCRTEVGGNFLKLLGMLQYLKELKLTGESFVEEKMFFNRGSFPQLQLLILDGLYIKSWVVELPCLDSLRELCIADCKNLEDLPEGLQHLDNFESLKIDSMDKSRQRFGGQVYIMTV